MSKGSVLPEVLEQKLPLILKQRIQAHNNAALDFCENKKSFVLYLPQVNLRKQHNPAFAFACHLANSCQVPVVVLAVVVDDDHHPSTRQDAGGGGVVFTARRVSFVLEALQQATKEWEDHGAGVAVRVHGHSSHRCPHHLTLAHRAVAVVTDEPFVFPYRTFVERLHVALRTTAVPFYTVDGSTTVPPACLLKKKQARDGNATVSYTGAPNKAWRWEEQTRPYRRNQVIGAVRDGCFDAPQLQHRLEPDFFLFQNKTTCGDNELASVQSFLPKDWNDETAHCPGKRPWTVSELCAIEDVKHWVVLHLQGVDVRVPPCQQTHGSTRAGMRRWNSFLTRHLADYAKLRNTISQPHAVSRMSCYLNYGCVSIFQIVHDVWTIEKRNSKGAKKFEDEIIKWREIGYVHCFASPDYAAPQAVLPRVSLLWLDTQLTNGGTSSSFPLETMATASTNDPTWNAMQSYLVRTGELHNNARMTWGKTIVHWQKHGYTVDDILGQMIYLNDRFALDGLSPPSYAGLLWCLGWCDKLGAGGSISTKTTTKYRFKSASFEQAERILLQSTPCKPVETTEKKRKRSVAASAEKRQPSITSYFQAIG